MECGEATGGETEHEAEDEKARAIAQRLADIKKGLKERLQNQAAGGVTEQDILREETAERPEPDDMFASDED